jgi:peptidoglycan-associated lipoprotein
MRNYIAPTLALVFSASLSACATKGYVREQVGALRTQTETDIAATRADIAAERTARMAGDSALTMDLNAVRGQLDSLRTEFGVKITALENGLSFALPVHFAYNDASVRDGDKEALNRFADIAKKYYTTSNITVEGFTDPAGTPNYNQKLSLRRAQSVQGYLEGQGLTASAIHAVGYGETRLVEPNATRDEPGAELNRRVVFVIESGPRSIATNDQPQTQTPQ